MRATNPKKAAWFHRLPMSLLGAVVAALLPAGSPASEPNEWRSTGEDLANWRQPTGDWMVVKSISLDPANPEKLVIAPGRGVLVNGGQGRTVNLISEAEFGDVELHVEFCIPRHSNSGIYLMGRYEIQVYDSYRTAQDQYPGIECGGIYPRWIDEKNVDGHSPRVNASRPPGEWQSFDISFCAPRFDASGKKTANARMVKVVHNGKVIHENVELKGPTRAAQWEDEKAAGPILLQGDHGPVAYRNLRVRSNTDWFKDARYGVFMHFLPGDSPSLARIGEFDVQFLARQLEAIGARYFVITLGQNSGFFNSPNSTYDKITGYRPGERCALRDMPLALYEALQPRDIKLMLYLPCQTPNQDARSQKAFGLPTGNKDQPIDLAFAGKWAEVIQEWADRYGDKVAGWWFDGGYDHIHFNEAIAQTYARAVKHGNPKALVTFNPGVKLIRHTRAENYTAGELNEPFTVLPSSRWVDGSQWHALTYLGSRWSGRDTRYPADRWTQWVAAVVAKEGVVTLDLGPNWDPQAGPIGSLAEAQVAQVKAIRAALASTAAAVNPPRLKRADSFLGIHFDFHAGKDCTSIGQNTTRQMIETVINQVHPDYLQIDCKGHPGLSSYPTRAGNPAPGFVGDPLRLWRQVTAEHGVALYMHYSGVWDSEAIRRHPDWAAINADGKTNGNATSFFGPYADRLLIPQLRELAGDYGVDGAWVDGECWASVPDYGEAAQRAFREATGIQVIPRKPGDPHWYEFLQFNREAFRTYLRHYLAEVKKTNPEMQLCSNWAFTDHMPEPVCAPVDFLSGDYSPEDSVNSARFSARYLARQGKPWDLMAWSFARPPGVSGSRQKSAVQLQREAAVVLALGGGFQAYFKQKRDGSISEDQMPVMAEVAKFCRARQAVCHHAMPVPQIALLYSTAAHYREINGLFSRDLSRIRGTLQALLEGQQSVEVLGEHHLAGRMAEYPLIVVPECDYLEPGFKQELVSYVKAGGNLLLVGPKTAALFPAELGITLQETPHSGTRHLAHAGLWAPTKGQTQLATLVPKTKIFGQLHVTNQVNSPGQPAASIARLGRGKIAATYFSFSQGYLGDRSATARSFLNGLARELFPKPLVEVKGSPDVDVAINRIDGRLAVNLVNTAGPHADLKAPIHDTIPPVGPLELLIRTPRKPARITLAPGGQSMPFDYRRGQAHLILPRLEIHSVILVHPSKP